MDVLSRTSYIPSSSLSAAWSETWPVTSDPRLLLLWDGAFCKPAIVCNNEGNCSMGEMCEVGGKAKSETISLLKLYSDPIEQLRGTGYVIQLGSIIP